MAPCGRMKRLCLDDLAGFFSFVLKMKVLSCFSLLFASVLRLAVRDRLTMEVVLLASSLEPSTTSFG